MPGPYEEGPAGASPLPTPPPPLRPGLERTRVWYSTCLLNRAAFGDMSSQADRFSCRANIWLSYAVDGGPVEVMSVEMGASLLSGTGHPQLRRRGGPRFPRLPPHRPGLSARTYAHTHVYRCGVRTRVSARADVQSRASAPACLPARWPRRSGCARIRA